jgi:hypothetical protein
MLMLKFSIIYQIYLYFTWQPCNHLFISLHLLINYLLSACCVSSHYLV